MFICNDGNKYGDTDTLYLKSKYRMQLGIHMKEVKKMLPASAISGVFVGKNIDKHKSTLTNISKQI